MGEAAEMGEAWQSHDELVRPIEQALLAPIVTTATTPHDASN
jgi:hypothetical protein